MKHIFWLLIVVFVGGGIIYFLSQSSVGTELDLTSNGSQQPQKEDGTTRLWEPYQDKVTDELTFSILHPATTTVSKVQDTIYELKYVGPNSEPHTEITDGFYISLRFATASSLDEYTSEVETESDIIVSTSVDGRETLSYSQFSQLHDQPVEHILLWANKEGETLLDIAYSTHGARAEEYQNTVWEILTTIEFTKKGESIDAFGDIDMTTLSIALLDYDKIGQESGGPVRGCDRIVFLERTIPNTNTPLNVAFETLFSLDQEQVGGWHNFIAKTNDTLSFERAEIVGGEARIYLTGELSGLAGVCDNPRARVQIEETALAFESIDTVQIYLNGERTDLQPDGR